MSTEAYKDSSKQALFRQMMDELENPRHISFKPRAFGLEAEGPIVHLTSVGFVIGRAIEPSLLRLIPMFDRVEFGEKYVLYHIRRPATRELIAFALQYLRRDQLSTALQYYQSPSPLRSLLRSEYIRRKNARRLTQAERVLIRRYDPCPLPLRPRELHRE